MQMRQDVMRIIAQDFSKQGGGGGGIGNFAGDGEDGIHHDRHRQLVPITVVDDAALGSNVEAALLLALGPLDIVAILENLQAEQTAAYDQQPDDKNSRQKIEPPL